MRSRPEIKVYLDPATPTPGSVLEARVVLVSRSETPIAGIDVHLKGQERRFTGYVMVGKVLVPQYETHLQVDLSARSPGALLTAGKHSQEFTFDLPADMPPSYRSKFTSIEYDLVVHVDIPWWPDRTERFVVPVVAEPTARVGEPGVFCTDDGGPRGTALYLETSLDSDAVPLGGVLHGAVSVANVAHHRVRRIELSLVAHEHRRGVESAGVEVARHSYPLAEGPPVEGKALRFRVTLPEGAQPSMQGNFIELRWSVEARAVVALGSDVTLLVPITVFVPPEDAGKGARPAPRVPPVGHERRAEVWAASAGNNGLACDEGEERMTLDVPGASLMVTLEPRKAGGLALVATVAWPRLGIELAVTELRWVDTFSGGLVTIPAPHFSERFTVRGREAAQVRAMLDATICRLLRRFDEAAVGDEGATLVSAGTAQNVEDLDAFVARAVAAARALGEAAQRVPPPAAMAAYVPAWRAFAPLLGARLVTGDMSLHDGAYGDAALTLATRWSKEGVPVDTLVRFPLPATEAEHEGVDAPRRLDGATQSLVDGVASQVVGLEVTRDAVEARLPAPIEDPATLEPLLAGLARIARQLAGEVARGPYR